MTTRILSAVLWIGLLAGPASAQQARVAVSPDTGSVGTIFRVVVRIEGAADAGLLLPDTLALAAPLENAARKREVPDTTGSGVITAIYSVTAWKPGTHALPPLAFAVQGAQGERETALRLPTLYVRSVLPADTTGIEPRPAKAVIGPSWVLWPFILLAVLLVAALAFAAWWWYRKRRARRGLVPAEPGLTPRERALRELDAATAARADLKAFYSQVSGALRGYLAALDPTWGADLTTSELALRTRVAAADSARIERLLHDADLVKFARRRVDAAEADAFWAAAKTAIETFDWPPPRAPEAQEAA